jgi:hypothetical protein
VLAIRQPLQEALDLERLKNDVFQCAVLRKATAVVLINQGSHVCQIEDAIGMPIATSWRGFSDLPWPGH